MKIAQLNIDGMHCGGCVARVTSALAAMPGATVDSVSVGAATVRYDDEALTPDALVQALEKIGFDARVSPPEPNPR